MLFRSRFQEKKSGVRMFAFGAPALAVVLAENAAEFALPVPVAREIFFAVIAIIGAKDSLGSRGLGIAGFRDEGTGKPFSEKMKSGIVIVVKPIKMIAVAAIIIVLCAFAVIYASSSVNILPTSGAQNNTRDDNTQEYSYSNVLNEYITPVTYKNDSFILKKADLPSDLRDNVAYYSTQFYIENMSPNSVQIYARTSAGAASFSEPVYSKVNDDIYMCAFVENTNVLMLFDKDKKPIAYAWLYINGDEYPKDIKSIRIETGFAIEEKILSARIKKDVNTAIDNAEILDESDFYYEFDKSVNYTAIKVKKDKLPASVRDYTNTTNIYCGKGDDYENVLKFAVSQYWIDNGKIIGEERYKGNIVCYDKYGENTGTGQYDYNLVAFFKDDKIVAVAYLDCSKIEGYKN